MNNKTKIAAAALVALLLGTGGALAHQTSPQGKSNMGQGMMGQGMTGQAMPGQGMMGQGMAGQGMMGQGMMGQGMPGMGMMGGNMPCQNQAADKKLTADDVRAILDGHLKWMGQKRLKVGNVAANAAGALVAEITTLEGSLAWKMEVDPKTGAMHMVSE